MFVCCSVDAAYSFTYNSSARTLHVKPMSVGLHNVGWLWCSTGLDAMHDDGFIATKDLAQKARGVKKLLGLIMQVENKCTLNSCLDRAELTPSAFAGFDETTPWGNMHRTPDWAIYRMSESRVTDKPLLVMEIGVSQQLTRSPKSKSPKETLQERAEGWLLSTMGITKAVLLIDLSKMQPVSDQSTVPGAGHSAGCINVTVQVWRINPDTALPRIDETHSFVVCADSEAWDDAEVPENFPKGITFRAEDIYGAAAEEGKTFVLPLSWLRTAIVNTWALHVDDVEARKVVNRARVSDITRGGV